MLFPVVGKKTAVEVEAGGKWFFGIVQRVLRITAEQTRQATVIENQAAELRKQASQIEELRDAVRVLQAREGELVAKAEAAASQSSAAQSIELSRRLGFLEGRLSS